MVSSTIQDQVDALVSRRVAEAKVQGVPSPDIEASAVFESIGMNLALRPRTVLFAAHLARNGVLAAVQAELKQADVLLASIKDSTNQTFEIRDTTSLEKAKTALLQLEDLSKVDPGSTTFKTYSSSVDAFLNNELAKNVKKKGQAYLARPGKEAAQDVASDYAALANLHTTLLDKLYALAVGVDNFLTSPISTVLGVSTAYRARQDLQDIIDSATSDVSGAQSRDYATRLIAARAALQVLGATPDLLGPVLDSTAGKPDGYALLASTDSAAAVATSVAGPFTVSSGSMSMTTGGSTVVATLGSFLPAGNNPAIYSSSLTFPITVPSGYHLFLEIETTPSVTSGGGWTGPGADGTYSHATYGGGWHLSTNYYRTFRAPLTPGAIATVGDLETAVTAALGVAFADAGITIALGTARAFYPNRLMVYLASAFQTVRVATHYATPGVSPVFYTLSAHSLFGFQAGQSGVRGQVLAQTVVDAVNFWFSTLCTASRNQDESFTITTLGTAPGTTLQLTGQVATDLGLPSSSFPTSSTVFLNGTVNGVAYAPFNAASLVQVGDSVVLQTGSSTVANTSSTSFTLSTPIQTFSNGSVQVTSSLVTAWSALSGKVQSSLSSVLSSKFAAGLAPLNASIAALSGDPTVGKQNAANALVNELKAILQGVVTDLSDASTLLPNGAASSERDNANGIIATLTERKFDKAADFFVQCKLHELFEMNFMTASYAGSMMKASSDFARTDIKFPDRTKDEDVNALVQTNRSLL